MEEKNTIIIDLDNSLYAHGFSGESQIHQYDMQKAMRIVRSQLAQIDDGGWQDVFLTHHYRTIGVFGDRGSGKTSFLVSLLQRCREELGESVEVLRMIDPTLVEHKKPIVLCVISMIDKLVEEKLKLTECVPNGDAYIRRKAWEQVKKPVACGIISIDKVGADFNHTQWQDEDYVIHTGLRKVGDAHDFEANLRRMISKALEILGKRAFILSFDDIDVDVEQGWNVLESLRRYLSDSHIISIVSGNIKLYGTLVRNELCTRLNMPEGKGKDLMTNELESQYMLKLLNPAYRINLLSLNSILQYEGMTVKVIHARQDDSSGTLMETADVKDVYIQILEGLGITDDATQQLFMGFLLSMSLRSQLHFMKDAWSAGRHGLPLDVFRGRLYAAGIDVDALLLNPHMANIFIWEYLDVIKGLPDCYLLLPTLPDKDANSNFMALTMIENENFRRYPALVLDYMLRIGYLRNVILPFKDDSLTSELSRYAGWGQYMSLKNNMGLTMAYLKARLSGGLHEHIPLYGLKNISKNAVKNAFDELLKEETDGNVKVVAMLPYVRIVHNAKNESSSYYSVFALLAVVGELLKCESEANMFARLNDMKLFRSYQMPLDGISTGGNSSILTESYGVETDALSVASVAHLMWEWKEAYHGHYLPAYVIGRIMTRFYSSLMNVSEKIVGDRMCIMVANLFNASIVEEARYVLPVKQHSVFSNNNLRTDTKVLKDNLAKAMITGKLHFSRWLLSCPVLNAFLDDDTSRNASCCMVKPVLHLDVYTTLCKIECKDENEVGEVTGARTSFSGEKRSGWMQSRQILLDGGIDEAAIRASIVDEPDLRKAVRYIEGTGLFGVVRQQSVKTFRTSYIKGTAAAGSAANKAGDEE